MAANTSTPTGQGAGSDRGTAARPSDSDLLTAACAVFADAGFRGAAVGAIAQRAGTTKPTLYAHFGSKDRLYQACLRREAETLTHWLFTTYEQAANLPVSEQVRADMRAFFDYAAAHPDGFRLLFNNHSTAGALRDELIDTITRRVAEQIRAAVAQRGPDCGPHASADLLAAMVVGIAVHGARHALLTQPTDPGHAGDLAASLANVGMRGLDRELMNIVDTTANE